MTRSGKVTSMPDQRVGPFLRQGTRVESEPLAEDATRAELSRIHEQLDAGRTNKFVRNGATGIASGRP